MQDISEFPFHDKPVTDLAASADGINETPSVVILADKATREEQAKAYAALEPLALEYRAAAKAADEDSEFLFFCAKSSSGAVPRVRQLCKLSETTAPQLILLDIPDNGGFYVAEGVELTTDGVRKWLSDFKGSKLERKQLN
jgi:nucleoredoxin